MWSPGNLVGTGVLNQHTALLDPECWLTKTALDDSDPETVSETVERSQKLGD